MASKLAREGPPAQGWVDFFATKPPKIFLVNDRALSFLLVSGRGMREVQPQNTEVLVPCYELTCRALQQCGINSTTMYQVSIHSSIYFYTLVTFGYFFCLYNFGT